MTNQTAAAATELPLAPGHWVSDPAHSSVAFTIRHLGVSKVRGRFARFTVDAKVGTTLESTTLLATIDTTSIDTGNTDRDEHVRSPEILDVQRHPAMSFSSTGIHGDGDTYQVDGELTIRGVTRPVTLDIEFGGVERALDGKLRAGFEATAEVSRKEFDVDVPMPPGIQAVLLGDVLKIQLDVQLVDPAH